MNHFVQALHQEAQEKAQRFRQAESEMIDVLIRLDEHKVFVHLGYASLYDYCLRELGLSESYSCNFISVARKSREVPELKVEITRGNLSVSKVRKIIPILTQENAEFWLEKAKTLTHKDLENEVAREKPEVLVPVGARYISEDRLALQLSISEELMDQLAQLRNLLSQKQKESVPLEKALEVVVGEYLERHDPVAKARRAMKRQEENQGADHEGANLPHICGKLADDPREDSKNWYVRQGMKQFLKHQVMYRDQGRCTFVYPNGQRCKKQRFLEMHHIKPVSMGGENMLENLTLLCSAHHKHLHLAGPKQKFAMHHTTRQQVLGLGG